MPGWPSDRADPEPDLSPGGWASPLSTSSAVLPGMWELMKNVAEIGQLCLLRAASQVR
ncbi:hypothetical protein [Streptomyces soliscabiei]|uniref:hypothetical protein n=1 Tax=Streptomyces soliscabiei TaxID=588897 RepID=UPI0029B9140F|nr:hypothetical protein [Streptomyces sp. NY05-11A]MDX2679789.1 hypothetical protein [Streptomyces sp. NY05-11A]